MLIKRFIYNLKPRFSVTKVPKICSWVDSVLTKNNVSVHLTSTFIKRGISGIEYKDYFVAKAHLINFESERAVFNHRMRNGATNRGKLMEPLYRNYVNQFECKNFLKDNSRKIFNLGKFEISGTVDGINSDHKEIIEIKTKYFTIQIHL